MPVGGMSRLFVLPVFQLDDGRVLCGKEPSLGHLRRPRDLVALFIKALLHRGAIPGRCEQGPARTLQRFVDELFMGFGCPITHEYVWVGAIIRDRIGDEGVKIRIAPFVSAVVGMA